MNHKTTGTTLLLAALFLAGCSGGQNSGSSSGTDASAQSSAAANGAGAPGAAAPGAAGAAGQGSSGRHHFAQALMSVNLSDAQKTQIRQIMSTARAEGRTQDPETRRKTFHDAYEKVQAVLTPEQRTAFNAKMAELRALSPVQAPTP